MPPDCGNHHLPVTCHGAEQQPTRSVLATERRWPRSSTLTLSGTCDDGKKDRNGARADVKNGEPMSRCPT